MSRSSALLEPSANFSCALFTIKYTPAGLAYTPSLLLHHWLIYLQTNLSGYSLLLLLYTIVFATTLYHIHARLVALETDARTDHTKQIAGILRDILTALMTMQSSILDILSKVSALGEDMDAMDADMANLATRINLVSKTLLVLQNNVEMAREMLGAGADAVSDSDLSMGDEVEVFWVDGDGMSEEEDAAEEEEEQIDVGAIDALVRVWLEMCAWPEECYDA
jgi:hypothetical protein